MTTIIAQRNNEVFLVTEDPLDNIKHARVLDRAVMRLYPAYPAEMLLRAGPWRTDVDYSEEQTAKLLEGVQTMEERLRDDARGVF